MTKILSAHSTASDFVLNRRRMIVSVGALTAGMGSPFVARAASQIDLPPLPYDQAALEPVISAATMGYHYGKHHKAYVDNLAKLVPGTRYEGKSLVEIVRASAAPARDVAVFNNAAQAWNHAFFWDSLAPKGGGKPPAFVQRAIEGSWTSMAAFREAFVKQSIGLFGSGWLWLCYVPASKTLALVETFNADTPIRSDTHIPLAAIDVWEHAYYVDYFNQRKTYVEAVFDKLMNWGAAEVNLARAMTRPQVSGHAAPAVSMSPDRARSTT